MLSKSFLKMSESDSYVYFSLHGEDFDPSEVTRALDIEPTDMWRKGDLAPSGISRKYACWIWSTARGKETIWIDSLVEEVVDLFESKVSTISELKERYALESTLSVILYIDMNDEKSTPALGHDLRTVNFLYSTQSCTAVDMYRYDSRTGA